MKRYLLGTDALVDMVSGDAAFTRWFDGEDAETMHLSVVSLAIVMAMVERSDKVDQRRLWREALTEDIPARWGERLLPFDSKAAFAWSAAYCLLDTNEVPEASDLYVVATAIGGDLTYVARPQVWHRKLNRLRLHDPWQASTSPT